MTGTTNIDFRGALNDEQYAVVTAPDGKLLVLAAAGTGKTRTLVYRVAWLVHRGVDPERILLLTFTNRAANEMLERARALVGGHVAAVWGGTFHHLANRLLRRHAPALRFPREYTILDEEDSRKLVTDCLKSLNLVGKEFPKPGVLLGLFGTAANMQTDLATVIEDRYSSFAVDAGDIVRVHEAYIARKRKLDAMDFDDLLVNCLRLFRECPQVLGEYQARFQHVLVDEYQDTNTIQAQMVDRLSEGHGNLMVVGDDFQCIYSWRGADFRNIMTFPDRHAGVRRYKLETNYRSVPEILAVANACIAGNPEQFQKTLHATRESLRKPAVARMRDGDEQARYVVEHIRRLLRDGYKASEIAVLYRAHFHSMDLQMTLTKERVAYHITSGARFFEQVHIKDACCLLRVLAGPEDFLAFSRILCLLPGIGEKTAERLWEKLGSRFDAANPIQRCVVRDALKPQARDAWVKIEPILEAYQAEGLNEDGGEVIHRFLAAFYEEHARNVFENADRRVEDLRELILYTTKFESVEEFLGDVALLTNLDADYESSASNGRQGIRLSTIHQAKGLEWPVVILIWVNEGMFPSARSMAESWGGEAEERRLFYVAVTRAKDDLLMCAPEVRRNRDGGVTFCQQSRFIEELDPGLIKTNRVGFF